MGINKISIGKISRRPMSIHIDNTKVDKSEKGTKLPLGPQIPDPGPMFPIQATTAVNVEVKSKLSNATIRVPTIMVKTYNTINTIVVFCVFWETTSPLTFTVFTSLGLICLITSFFNVLKAIRRREIFTPPLVPPAEAPVNISRNKIHCANIGHKS